MYFNMITYYMTDECPISLTVNFGSKTTTKSALYYDMYICSRRKN